MKITEHIHAVKIPFTIPIAPGRKLERFVYSFIVSGEGQTCLVDGGVAGSGKRIIDSLAEFGKSASDISLMILTHAHPDHIGGALAMQKMSNCRIAAHPAAQEWVEDVEKQFRERPVPGFHELVGGPVKIDHFLQDSDRIELGGMSLQVLFTPGHSRCSISLFCREQGVLLTGDAIPQGNDLPIYDDPAVSVASIRKLQQIKGVKQLLASWSDPRPDADPYQIMEDGLVYFQRIHTAMRQLSGRGRTIDPMRLCQQMVELLGLPEVAVNPLVARSFVSHLSHGELEKL